MTDERSAGFKRFEVDPRAVELVSARAAQEFLVPLLDADRRLGGFASNPRGLLVRPRAAGGFEAICLGALKGGQFALQWGLSLPYVPSGWWTSKIRWHRDAKTAQFDLFEWPQREGHRSYLVAGLHGRSALQKSLRDAWTELRDDIAGWFAHAATDEGALEIAVRPMRGWELQPSPPRVLVSAYIYAHRGQRDEATRALNEFDAPADEDAVLRKALSRVLDFSAQGAPRRPAR
jgi:hypothetical protein